MISTGRTIVDDAITAKTDGAEDGSAHAVGKAQQHDAGGGRDNQVPRAECAVAQPDESCSNRRQTLEDAHPRRGGARSVTLVETPAEHPDRDERNSRDGRRDAEQLLA